jgi:photosystem II stability/assembly factor-like uncharacterized protein
MKKIIALLLLLNSLPFYAQWWTLQNSGVTANLNDVNGITGNEVLIVGNSGTILKTIDGGVHWVQKTSSTISNLMKIQFVNPTIGYAVGENGTLLKTTDSGESWSTITTGITSNFYGLSCLSENVFYISGDNGLVLKTIDGGTNFSNESYVGNYSFKTIQFLNDQVGYACSFEYSGSDSNAFIKTNDGGETWTFLSNEVTSFYFLNENIGFLKTFGPVFKTIDGGVNLIYMGDSNSQSADLFSMNENLVWSVENTFTLCNCSYFCIEKRELDNTQVPSAAQNCYADTAGNPPFEAITFADATTGYVVGDYGIIYKNATGTMEDLGVAEFNKNSIYISPNPASELITIENKSNTQINSITITDMNGRIILEDNTAHTTLDVNSLSNGVYFIQFASEKGSITKKLIKK